MSNQKGFSAIEGLLIVIAVIGFGGWLVWSRNDSQEISSNQAVRQIEDDTKEDIAEDVERVKTYILENEGLSFEYDSEYSSVETFEPEQGFETYNERVRVLSGSVTLSILAGIDGIGGSPQCVNGDGDACEVIDTMKGTFLGNPVTYRLIKAAYQAVCETEQQVQCGVSFLIDSSVSNEVFGACCGTLSAEGRNLGMKGQYAGSVLVSIIPDESIADEKMFDHPDILETTRIIESIDYRSN